MTEWTHRSLFLEKVRGYPLSRSQRKGHLLEEAQIKEISMKRLLHDFSCEEILEGTE
jgi:hypothetical protein